MHKFKKKLDNSRHRDRKGQFLSHILWLGKYIHTDAVDKKKCVIVYGIKKKNITCKLKRDKEETKGVKDLLKKLKWWWQ